MVFAYVSETLGIVRQCDRCLLHKTLFQCEKSDLNAKTTPEWRALHGTAPPSGHLAVCAIKLTCMVRISFKYCFDSVWRQWRIESPSHPSQHPPGPGSHWMRHALRRCSLRQAWTHRAVGASRLASLQTPDLQCVKNPLDVLRVVARFIRGTVLEGEKKPD